MQTGLAQTLPPQVLKDGCAEVIKYGIIADRELFDMLDLVEPLFEEIIARCVKIKGDIVGEG